MKTAILAVLCLTGVPVLGTPVSKRTVDYTQINYPPLHEVPAPKGGWGSVDYSPKHKPKDNKEEKSVFKFTSEYYVRATGAEVVNGTTPTPGPEDALGLFYYGINGPEDTICFNITLINVVGEYQSRALTSTHIHEGARGASGPPRVVFPNPVGDDKFRRSVGCITGPFMTGIKVMGTERDTGEGFRVEQIEANPKGFFTDAHTALFVPGVVRGQLG